MLVDEASPVQPAGCSHFDLLVFRVGFGRVVKVIHLNFRFVHSVIATDAPNDCSSPHS